MHAFWPKQLIRDGFCVHFIFWAVVFLGASQDSTKAQFSWPSWVFLPHIAVALAVGTLWEWFSGVSLVDKPSFFGIFSALWVTFPVSCGYGIVLRWLLSKVSGRF